MFTKCVHPGDYAGRLGAGRIYCVFEIDRERMRIRVQDSRAAFEWYPAELFAIDLLNAPEQLIRERNLQSKRFRLSTSRMANGEVYGGVRSSLETSLVRMLVARGIRPDGLAVPQLIARLHALYPDPIPHPDGSSLQVAVANWYERMTRINRWLHRVTPETVTHEQLSQCFRLTRELSGQGRAAFKRLKTWMARYG